MIRRAAWIVCIVLVAVAAIVAGGLAFLRTEAGGRAAARAISALASTPGESELAVERIEPGPPSRLAARGIVMRDKAGPWLTIDRAEVIWSPLALLRGQLRIDRATAAGARLQRLPESEPAADDGSGLSLPSLPVSLRLDRFTLDDVEIGAAILGETVTLSAGGRLAAETGGRARTDMTLTRTNGVGGEATLAVVWNPADKTLDLDARMDEPRGGVIGRALGLADQPPVTVAVAGHGPITAWAGRVDIALAEGVGVNARIRSEHRARTLVHVTGRADVAALLEEKLRPLVLDGIGFSATLGRWPGGGFRVDELDVSTTAARLTGAGTIDLDAGRFAENFHVTLDARDPAALAPLIAPLGFAGFSASASLSGALDRPKVDAVGRIEGVRVDGPAGEGFATGETRWTAGLVPRSGRLAVNASAEFAELSAGATDIDALVGGQPRLTLAGSLDRLGNTFDLDALKLAAPAATVRGAGTLELSGGSFTGWFDATAPELAAFAALIGPNAAGRIHLRADIGADEGRSRAEIVVDTADLRSGIPAADVLLGSEPTLRATASVAAHDAIHIEDLALDGAGLEIRADATLRDGAVDALYRAHIADVAPVAGAAGLDLRGAVSIDGTASGRLDDPNVSAAVLLADGGFTTISIPSARIDLKAEQVSSRPRGTIAADATLDQGSIRARAPFACDGKVLRIGPFKANGLGATASGELAVPLDRGALRGALRVRYNGGDRPAVLAGYRLRGDASADVKLASAKGEQTADFTIVGHSLVLEGGEGLLGGVDALALSGSLTGSEDRLRGNIKLSSERLVYGETTLAALQGRVSGTNERADFQLTARAPAGLAGEARARGTLASRDGKIEIIVRAIDGRPGGHSLALRQPLSVIIDRGELAATGVDLAVDRGGVTGAFRTGIRGTDGELKIRRLPLSLLAAANPDLTISGTLDADGAVTTKGDHLAGGLTLSVNQVKVSPRADAKPLDATATLALESDAVTAGVRVTGIGQPLVANARVPATIDARSFALRLRPSAPLAGRLTWAGPVGRLWELLPLPDQRLTGDADIDLALGGRVENPRIEGALKLGKASYEHFLTGTVIENLELTATASGSGTLTVELSGNDGGDGKINGHGTARLGDGLRPTADIAVVLDQATLVRRDDVTATLSGTVTFRETAEGARLAGAIATDRMQIRLVDRLPPSVVELDVTEINLPPGRAPRSKAGGEKASSWAAALDVRVDMPRRVFVRGRGLESEWQGDLVVTGNTVEPVLTGSVRLLSGVFDFAGKRFMLEKGEIGFTGGKSIDPTINLEALRETEEVTAIIAVSGTAMNPEVELRSRPDLPESEILSRVLFDKDVAKLGPIEAAQLGLALDTLASGESMSEDALSYVRDLLGLDVLTVDTGNGQGDGPTLGVGRYVGEGLYVGAKQGTEPDSTSGSVELEVLPGLSIESELGQDEAGATGALGLRWKWDY